MLKATITSLLIMLAAMLLFCLGNIGLHIRGRQTQIGLGALLEWTALNPLLWFFAVAVFFIAFLYFMRHQGA